jgi:two-component system phosphate regulon response regulator PhoB
MREFAGGKSRRQANLRRFRSSKSAGEFSVSQQEVLIVEDETEIADLIRFHAQREGFEARVAYSGRAALEEIEKSRPDVVSLDIMLPDLDGLEVCRRLKRSPDTASLPIVIVSAKGEEAEVVAGLELGADDYVTKPFSPRVLMARLKAVLRRREEDEAGQSRTPGRLSLGGDTLDIDAERHVVRTGGQRVDLTLTEFRLLHFLAQRPGFVRTRDQIVSAIRGEGTVLSSRAVDVHVASLRRKLGEAGALIETVRGVGYRVANEAEAEA